MQRADVGVNVGYATFAIFSFLNCASRASSQIISSPSSRLKEELRHYVRFISSENHNLRYFGVTGLDQIVQVNRSGAQENPFRLNSLRSYAAEHQMVVVDCLEETPCDRVALLKLTQTDTLPIMISTLFPTPRGFLLLGRIPHSSSFSVRRFLHRLQSLAEAAMENRRLASFVPY